MVRKITKTKIIELYLNDYNRRYYLREMASLLKKPHQTIKPYVESLVREGILIKDKRMNVIDYNLNFKNKRIFDYIVISEKESLSEKLNEETLIRILFDSLSVFFENNTFVVFGSSADKIRKGSDIDLLVIGRQNISKIVEDFEKVYNKKIHKVQVSNIKKIGLTLVKEIYKKHLILNNTEQVIRFFGGLYEKNKLV